MSDNAVPVLGADQLRQLARQAQPDPACPDCAGLVCPGWESVPGGYDASPLRRVGTLRGPGDDVPTLAEYHPAGTHAWSADAPIAPAFHPYNRCEVWQCARCARAFLRYTEYGGYYKEDRIRAIDATRVADVPAP